jgi:hypothetical protein
MEYRRDWVFNKRSREDECKPPTNGTNSEFIQREYTEEFGKIADAIEKNATANTWPKRQVLPR